MKFHISGSHRLKREEKLARSSSVFISEMMKRKKQGTLHEIFNDWAWILRYTRKYKGAVIFYTLTGIVSSTFSLVSSVASKYAIDIITGYQMSRLWIVAAIMVGSMFASLLLKSVTNRISAKLSININNDIQAEIFSKIADADWLSLNHFSNGDLLNRFNSDVSSVAGNAINWLPNLIVSVYQFASTFFVIWYYNPIMACIALSSAPILLLFSKVLLRKQRNYYKQVRSSSSKLMAFETEAFYNLDTIKSFGIAGLYERKLRDRMNGYKEKVLDYNRYSILTNIGMTLLSSGVQFIAFGYCLWLLWTRQITYGTMTLFLQQRSSLTSSFNQVISIIPNILTASVSAGRVRELLQLPTEVHSRRETQEQIEAFKNGGLEIGMEGVEFAYTGEDGVVIRSEFQAEPGKIVAMVGPSGEGKTTMIRLILGLIHPQKGKVTVRQNGEPIELNADTRELFSYVPQGNTILSGTIADNMRMVKEDASDEEIQQALDQACAWPFVSKMKKGIYSEIGERGKGLSEGQAQRIAIARALLRNAPVLLLDEATSALDVETERKVLKNILREHPEQTIIVTTHRPSVLNLCSQVYRIHDKKTEVLSEEQASRLAMDF